MMKYYRAAVLLTAAILFFSCNNGRGPFVEVPESHLDEVINTKILFEEISPVAGIYDDLILAVENNKLSAVYLKGRCNIIFEAVFNANDKEFPVKWTSGSIEGIGQMKIGDKLLKIKISELPDGCPDIFKNEATFIFTKASNWKKILVLPKNVPIFSEPERDMEMGISFKGGDLIYVLEIKENWYRVEKIGNEILTGWIDFGDI